MVKNEMNVTHIYFGCPFWFANSAKCFRSFSFDHQLKNGFEVTFKFSISSMDSNINDPRVSGNNKVKIPPRSADPPMIIIGNSLKVASGKYMAT